MKPVSVGSTDSFLVRIGKGIVQSPGVLLLTLVAFALFVLPVMMIIISAFSTAAPGEVGEPTLASFLAVVTNPDTYVLLGNSLIFAICSVIIGVGLAIVLAWLTVRTDSPLRGLVTPAIIVLFATPQIYVALSWTLLARSPSGSLNRIGQFLFGPEFALFDSVSWGGLILVAAFRISSLAYLLLLGPFGAVNSSLEEAGRMAGATRLRAFIGIELPVLAPALFSAAILGFVSAMGFLDIPLLLGMPAGINVLSTEIYASINERFPAEYAGASTNAMFIMLAVAIIMAIQTKTLGKRSFITVGGKSHRRDRIRLGKWRIASTIFIGLFVLIAVLLPFLQLLLSSLQPYAGVYQNLGLNNYVAVLQNPQVIDAFGRSFVIGISSGLIATGLAVTISVVAKRSRSMLRNIPQSMAIVLLAMPGVTVGLGILSVILILPPAYPLYGTVLLNVIGLSIAMTPIANRLTSAAVAQVGPEMEESARMSGASSLRAVVGILVRLILPSFVASWFVTGVIAAGNLEIPALLSSSGNEPITMLALQLMQQGSYSQAAAVASLFLIFILILFAIGMIFTKVVAVRRNRATQEITTKN